MIEFRCWYCNRYYKVADSRIGDKVTCACKNRLRIPKRSGGNCRAKTPMDWFLEIALYGGGGALLGFGLGVLIASQFRGYLWEESLVGVGALTVIGLAAGIFGGERGVVWLGRMIRDREES